MKKVTRKSIKNGFGEFLGFALCVPIVMVCILFIINIFQIAMCEERLIYAVYKCGREAVMCYDNDPGASDNDISNAKGAANAMLQEIIPGGEITISVKGGWTKGNVAAITVTENLHTVLGIQNGSHSRMIYMMIEHSKWAD